MAFKIKDGLNIGTVNVFSSGGVLQVSAPSWITARTVSFATGDSTGSFSIKGDADVSNVALTLNTLLSGTATTKINEANVTYGSSGKIPVFTVDAKGRITAITETNASLEFTIAGDATSDLFQGGTFKLAGGNGITTTVVDTGSTPTGTSVTIALDSTDDVTFAAVTAGNVQIAPGANNNTITTSTGDLNLVSASNIINLGVNVTDSVVVAGNLTVNGITTTVNSSTITVDDKNLELGSVPSAVVSATGTVGTISGTGPWTATITGMSSTSGLVIGSALTATAGTGTLFGGSPTSALVTSIASATSVTYTVTGGTTPTAGTVTNISTTGATDVTADGGGITLRGSTNKTILWIDATDRWTFNQAIEASSIQNTAIGTTAAAAGTFTDLIVNGNATIGDSAADTITVGGRFVTGTVLRSAQADTNTLALAAYDVNGAAYVNLITLTASNTPTLALTSDGVGTINNMSIGATTASTGIFTQLTVNGSNLNTSISPTGTGTVTISPGGQLNLGTATKITDIVGNIVATGSGQTVNISPTGGTGTVTISPSGAALTLGASGQTTSLAGNVSAGGTQTITLTPSGTVTISPVGATLTLGTSGQTTSMVGQLSLTGAAAFAMTSSGTVSITSTGTVSINPGNAVTISPTSAGGTVTINPAGALTINPSTASTINNTSIGVTTAAAGRFTTVISTDTTNATSQTVGAVQIDGGVSVDKDIYHSGSHVLATATGTKIAETRALQYNVAQSTEFVLDTFASANYRYAVYQVQITQGANIQVSEVRLAHNGTSTTMTEYAVLETSAALAPAFTSDIDTGNVRLKVTMTSATAAVVNILRTLMVI